MTKKSDKLFTPGNIVLGIIIIVLIGSLFFDFFGGGDEEEIIGCPRAIDNLIVTNVVFAEDGVPFSQERVVKPEDNPEAVYTISALLRNVGDEEIVIAQLGLTEYNFGPLNLVDVEDAIIPPKSMKSIEYQVQSAGYHKIDLYTNDPCQGVAIWHEGGEGSKYEWELEAEATNTTIEEDMEEEETTA